MVSAIWTHSELVDSRWFPVLSGYQVSAPFLTFLLVVTSSLFIGRVWISDTGATTKWTAAFALLSPVSVVLYAMVG